MIETDLSRIGKLVGAVVVIAGVAILWGGLPGEVGEIKQLVRLMQVQIQQQEVFRRTYLCVEMGYDGDNIMTCPLMLEDMGEPAVGAPARLEIGN